MGARESRVGREHSRPKSLTALLLGLCICLALPVDALARALVRFVHAVPGAGKAAVELTSGSQTIGAGSAGFGQSTTWRSLPAGNFRWRLTGAGGNALASGRSSVGNGAYTAILLAQRSGVALGIYRDQPAAPGKSLIRVIHAAPELGSPSLKFDSTVVDSHLDFTAATRYLSVPPGAHSFAAMAPGSSAPLLAGSVKLLSDVSYTVIVVGTRGQRVRVVSVSYRPAPLTHRAGPARGASRRRAPATKPEWVTVQPGDSLWKIARTRLGSQAADAEVNRLVIAIWNANALRIGTGDPSLIFPGQRLRVPSAERA